MESHWFLDPKPLRSILPLFRVNQLILQMEEYNDGDLVAYGVPFFSATQRPNHYKYIQARIGWGSRHDRFGWKSHQSKAHERVLVLAECYFIAYHFCVMQAAKQSLWAAVSTGRCSQFIAAEQTFGKDRRCCFLSSRSQEMFLFQSCVSLTIIRVALSTKHDGLATLGGHCKSSDQVIACYDSPRR